MRNLKPKTVHHRDGSVTEYEPVHVPMRELASRVAAWLRLIPNEDENAVEGRIVHDGKGGYITRLCVTRKDNGREVRVTKTGLREYFVYREPKKSGSYLTAYVELDEDGAHFLAPRGWANCWLLAPWFSI